jgi:hypothetical protein
MSFSQCKAGMQHCPYAEKDRCTVCGKDRRKRPDHDSRKRAGRKDSRTSRKTAKYRNGLPEYLVPRTIGIDGEGNEGRYFLLAASDENGEHWEVWNPKGLRTRQCFDFLVNLPHEGTVLWGFSFNYDVNMMLVDIPVAALRRLHADNTLRWREYRIEWIPKKKLYVSKWRMEGLKQVERIAWNVVWDMFPWQQCSFVSWLQRNQLAPPDQIESIAKMKGKRRDFSVEMKDEILRYCLDECRLLARGATLLHELLKDQGFRIFQYYSPATASKALMQQERVQEHFPGKYGMQRNIKLKDFPLQRLFQAAYFGGRAETSLVGPLPGPLYKYDINSAYPYAATLLPCWRHGSWELCKTRDEIHPWSLVYVRWKPLLKKQRREPMMWGPLPIRPRVGSLRWPTHGSGWYWGTEVRQVQHLAAIKVGTHIRWVQRCNCQPFDYLLTLYNQRLKLKAVGDERQFINKLAMNATYGALAQHPSKNHPERVPRWRNAAWAGIITAHVRGMVASLLDDDAVMVATDAVVSRRPLAAPVGKALGDWELVQCRDGFFIGPGVYFLQDSKGDWEIQKSRGYTYGSLTIEAAMQAWEKEGRNGHVIIDRSMFIGLGAALFRTDGITGDPFAQLWRTFRDDHPVRRFTLEPRREWRNDDPRDGRSWSPSPEFIAKGVVRDQNQIRLHAMTAKLARDLTDWERLQEYETLSMLQTHRSIIGYDGELNA